MLEIALGVLAPLIRRFWPYASLGVLAMLCWHFQHRAMANADALRTQAAQFQAVQKAARAAAQAALHDQEAVYQARAQEADNAYQTQLAAAQSAADRYITAHRVQPATFAGGPGAAAALAQSGNAGIPAPMPADAVMVSAGDVQACTEAVTYGLKAHEWAIQLDH
jgi:hypothetical protein